MDARDVPNDVQSYAKGPSKMAQFYTSCWYKGSHFRVNSKEKKRKTTADARVACTFYNRLYYGRILNIVVLSYGTFQELVFKVCGMTLK